MTFNTSCWHRFNKYKTVHIYTYTILINTYTKTDPTICCASGSITFHHSPELNYRMYLKGTRESHTTTGEWLFTQNFNVSVCSGGLRYQNSKSVCE